MVQVHCEGPVTKERTGMVQVHCEGPMYILGAAQYSIVLGATQYSIVLGAAQNTVQYSTRGLTEHSTV